MDLESIWKRNNDQDEGLNKLLDEGNFSKFQSRLPLKKLRTNLLIGLVVAILMTIGYLVLFFYISFWQVRVCLGVMIVFNLIVMIDSWKLFRKTPAMINPSNSLKEELMLHCNSFQRWWSVQRKMGLFVYPVAAAGGFILGGSLGSGKPVEEFLYNGKMLAILGITILILVPICYFGAQRMFNIAYGKYLKQLKASIDDLD